MKKGMILFLLICLLVSILLNFFLTYKIREFYLRLNKMRLDPLELHSINSKLNDSISSEKDLLLFIGDSRAADWPVLSKYSKYEYINLGVNGLTSSQLNLRKELTSRFCIPEYIIIQIGINDLKVIPLVPGQKEEIITNCIQNIQSVTNYSKGMGAKVIVCTIFPTGEVPFFRKLVWSRDVTQAINKINSFLFNLESESVFIFDTYSILSDDSGKTKKEFRKDFLHINSAGYERINEELNKLLKEISN